MASMHGRITGLRTASPYHKCTRSGGEQRGITVKESKADGTASWAFAQLRGRTHPECSQLPKLMSPTPLALVSWSPPLREIVQRGVLPAQPYQGILAAHQKPAERSWPVTRSDQVQTPTLAPGVSQVTLRPGRLLDAPLLDLLAELDIPLEESSITDPEFTGAAVVTGDRVVLSMRSGQPDCERDAVARALLGRVLNVPLASLPEPYRITEV